MAHDENKFTCMLDSAANSGFTLTYLFYTLSLAPNNSTFILVFGNHELLAPNNFALLNTVGMEINTFEHNSCMYTTGNVTFI